MVKIHLSRLLGEKRWTQKDLADATGIRPSTINEWYHELVPRLNVDHIDKICEALDCTIRLSHKMTFEMLLNIFQASFFKFLFKSGFCILYEKILHFVRKATKEEETKA